MGSTALCRPAGTTNDDFFTRELLDHDQRIVASATLRGVYYAAVDTGDADRGVVAYIVRTGWTPRSTTNFWFSAETEDQGPPVGRDRAPAKVLDALSPATSPAAIDWRQRCRERLRHLASLPTPRRGDLVTLRFPVEFSDGNTLQVLRFAHRNYFTDPDEPASYHLPGWRDLAEHIERHSA